MKTISITVATIVEASSPADEAADTAAVVTTPPGRCNHRDGNVAVCSWYSHGIIFRSKRTLVNASPGVSGTDYRLMACGSYLGEPGRWFSTR